MRFPRDCAMGKWDEQANEIFLSALELPLEAREQYLANACAETSDLRSRVDALFEAAGQAQAENFLEHSAAVAVSAVTESAGTVIGRNKLLQQIGEGGFGVVFMAEQEFPVRRRVALTIIKLGMDTKQAVARFEAQRQALAMMDHPSVARIFDGGATETGRPYFVMELVRGTPITHYCDQHKLTIRQRLE